MFVLSSPSGAGKTSLGRALLEKYKDLTLSISVTTRSPRPGEVEGKDYFFKTKQEFQLMVDSGQFLEYATVFDNSYGTPKDFVLSSLEAGQDVLFDIDWQGTQQLSQETSVDLVSVFILPPSIEELRRRLQTRAQDSQEIIQRRMSKAIQEISHWAEYEYVIVNYDFATSLSELESILQAERLKRNRQTGLSLFVKKLSNER